MADTENRRRFPLRAVLISAAVGAAIAIAYAVSVGLFSLTDAGMIVGYLANAFTVPGALLAGAAGLIFSKRQGTFDGLTYSARYTMNSIMPQFWLTRDEFTGKPQSYREYCEKKREKEKGRPSTALALLISGGFYLLLALICLFILHVYFPGTELL